MASVATLSTDYRTITEACGLLDRSERGKLALRGADAASFLQGQVSNDIEGLAVGDGCYAALLTPKGKMLGDVRVLNAGQELLLDTERIALQALFNMIRRFSLGYSVELHKRTVERGLVSLIGPEAAAVAGLGELPAQEHAHVACAVGGVPTRAIRTDVGVDLLCDAGELDALRAALEATGAAPVSEAAAECLRVEHGRPRYGIDLDETVIPQEAGLNERAVSFTKGCYVGQETVARLYYRGKPNRQLRGLRLSAPASEPGSSAAAEPGLSPAAEPGSSAVAEPGLSPAAEPGDELSFEGRVVGRLTSVVSSPRFGPIALGFVRREAPIGSTVAVGAGAALTAEVTELPFR